MLVPPRVRCVAHDREQPGTTLAARGTAESVEILERAQVGLLHDVLRVVVVPRGPIASRAPGAPVAVSAKLSEWKVELSASTVPAGTVTFTVTNAGSIPHAFEIEGHGIEKQTDQIQPGSTATLTLTLKLGTYEVYCPVGEGSHQKLGMETHLKAVAGQSSSGYGDSERGRSDMSGMGESRAMGGEVQSIRVTSGGPVIQILPA